jgi:hypothetical protein
MYETFGLAGIQLPEKYKENFDVSSEGVSTCTVIVFDTICIHRILAFTHACLLINIFIS